MPSSASPRHPKVDARLSYLLSLPKKRLEALKALEDEKVASLQEQARTISSSIADAAERALRLRDVGAVTPLTAGVQFRSAKKFLMFETREAHISALVRFEGSAADLKKLGAEVYTQAGDVFTISAPLSAIPALQRSRAVRSIELARAQGFDLDVAVPRARIDTLHRMNPAVTGKGVIIGILDSALDIYHPDFRTPAHTRVRYLWDQNLEPRAGENAPPLLPGMQKTYGVEYDRDAIELELKRFELQGRPAYETVRHAKPPISADDPAHGTLVAGAAAGNGRAANGQYVGAAPEAELIFVSLKRPYPLAQRVANDPGVLDGCAYIFARAAELGMPCVINRSGSDNQGPHDGSTLGEEALDHYLRMPGRAITLAAGNSNRTATHTSGDLRVQNPAAPVIRYQQSPAGKLPKNNDAVEIWYDGHDRVDVTLTIETQPPTTIGPLAPGESSTEITLPGGARVKVESFLNDPGNGDNLISVLINVEEAGTHVPLGDWTFALTGTTVVAGTFHAWLDRNNRGLAAWKVPVEDTMTLGVPSTAKLPITVGAVSKDITPIIYERSGRGPTRDGRVKPDITAVGVNVTLPTLRDMSRPKPGDLYETTGGTSLSTPLVAGACALLFQCRGKHLSCSDLKQMLRNVAGTTGIGAVPNNDFGYGYLQMGDACVTPAPDVDVWLRDHPDDTGQEPSGGAVCWLSPDIEILDRAGNVVSNPAPDTSVRVSNIVRVTVRNRGAQPARNTEVYLYWARPATNLPFPDAWSSARIFTGDAPDFTQQGNRFVVPLLAQAGASGDSVQVQFGWGAPPSGLAGAQERFCFMVRLEHENDPSQLGAGGAVIVSAKNNIALRNLCAAPSGATAVETTFDFVGSSNADSLQIDSELAAAHIELRVPVQALPWRFAAFIEQHGPRSAYDGRRTEDPLNSISVVLEGAEVRERTDIEGAQSLALSAGIATIALEQGKRRLWFPSMRVMPGARFPVSIAVTGAQWSGSRGHVHVAQRSDGRLLGGVTLELRT